MNEDKCDYGCSCGICKGIKNTYDKIKLYFKHKNSKNKPKNISLQNKLLFGDDY